MKGVWWVGVREEKVKGGNDITITFWNQDHPSFVSWSPDPPSPSSIRMTEGQYTTRPRFRSLDQQWPISLGMVQSRREECSREWFGVATSPTTRLELNLIGVYTNRSGNSVDIDLLQSAGPSQLDIYPINSCAVSYTHLTLPTKLSV